MTCHVNPMVACCIRHPGPRQHVLTAIVREEAVPRIVPSSAALLAQLGSPNVPSVLVYDLAPWDETAIAILKDLRRRLPALPVLLYVPSLPGVASLLVACGTLGGVEAELQRDEPQDVLRVRAKLRKLIASTPGYQVVQMFRGLAPTMPRHAVSYVRWVVGRLSEESDCSALTVAAAARDLALSERTLERAVRRSRWPPPKELLDWIILLFVYLTAATGGRGAGSVCRSLGLDAQRLYRIRGRLLPKTTRVALRSPAGHIELVLLEFASRCRGSRRPAEQVARASVANVVLRSTA